MSDGNLYQNIPAALPAEITDCLLQSGSLRIERILSRGQCSPPGFWYDQEQSEWVLLIQGAARLGFCDPARSVVLTPGSYINIPAHVAHRVEWTCPDQESIWLAVFY